MLFEEDSGDLQVLAASFTGCLANKCPPWAAYQALMSGKLSDTNKHPYVRPVEVRETWRQIAEKCILVVVGPEAKERCRT